MNHIVSFVENGVEVTFGRDPDPGSPDLRESRERANRHKTEASAEERAYFAGPYPADVERFELFYTLECLQLTATRAMWRGWPT